MAIQSKTYTADELWELSQLPDYADKHLELIDGELIEMTPSSILPGWVSSRIDRAIGAYADAHDLGYTSTAEGAFELSPKNVVAPDVGFVVKSRVTGIPSRYYKGAPDLAVEVVSPTDSLKKVLAKAARYINYGTRMVWIVYADDGTAAVCRPSPEGDMSIQEIGADGVLDGGDILPGFKIALRDVFKGLSEE